MRRTISAAMAGLVLILLVVVGSLFASKQSAAQQSVYPPPPRSNNHGFGFPALTPHINLSKPNLPTFTAQDVEQYVSQTGSPVGPLVKGAHLTFIKILFVTSSQASDIMGGEYIGLPANAPVCYVVIHGPFLGTNLHLSPSAHIKQPPVVDTTEIVLDGRTGNLLVWGAPATGYP
ncbi:MAG TPA: hypothetical protein VFA09_22475 [Ktedonobacteraceae bacterium]|nr:hypothetical protein [Ktedonobacteraceae bacterium]